MPTLVLHGHKGFSERMKKAKNEPMSQQSVSSAGSEKATSHMPSNDCRPIKRSRVDLKLEPSLGQDVICIDDSSDNETISSAATPVKFKTEYGGRKGVNVTGNGRSTEREDPNGFSPELVSVKEEEPPEEAWLRTQDAEILCDEVNFGPSVHLTEVLTTWVPLDARKEFEKQKRLRHSVKTKDDEVVVLDSEDAEVDEVPYGIKSHGVDTYLAQRRLHKRGVHHPKFMILFETSGSVVVVVSTSNLSPQHSVDASWVQRFEPSPQPLTENGVTDATRCDGSDFGHVLANYLECQSHAAREGQMIPEAFLRTNLGITSLDDFRRRYRFEESQVHLIATVPGEHKGRQRAGHLGKSGTTMTFLYGSQRVNDILCRLSASSSPGKETHPSKPWLPRSLLSDQDRLIMQPTSFGGHWKRANLTDLIRLYLDNSGATTLVPGRSVGSLS